VKKAVKAQTLVGLRRSGHDYFPVARIVTDDASPGFVVLGAFPGRRRKVLEAVNQPYTPEGATHVERFRNAVNTLRPRLSGPQPRPPGFGPVAERIQAVADASWRGHARGHASISFGASPIQLAPYNRQTGRVRSR